MQTNSDARLLQPSAERFREDGAPSVRLSPTKSLRNAVIIYDAIKSVPDKTLLRGDFDRVGKPWIYFPERDKKRIGKLSSPSTIKARNIDIDRQDMCNFLNSIADAALGMNVPDQRSLCAAAVLNKLVTDSQTRKRDVKAGDIREPVRVLSYAYKRIERQKRIDMHQLRQQASRIQLQRFGKFCAIRHRTFSQLSEALKTDKSSRYDVKPSLAVFEMKQFLSAYRKDYAATHISFADYVRATDIPAHVAYFARRWIAISQPTPTTRRMKFDTDAWASELDKICPLILKAFRQQKRNREAATAPLTMPAAVPVQRVHQQPDRPAPPVAPSQVRLPQRQMPPLPSLPELPPLPPSPSSPSSSPTSSTLPLVRGLSSVRDMRPSVASTTAPVCGVSTQRSEPALPDADTDADADADARSMLISDSFSSVSVLPPPPDDGLTETVTARLGADSDIGLTVPDMPTLASDSALIADMQAMLKTSASGTSMQHIATVQHTSLSSTDTSSTDLSSDHSADPDRRS